MTFKEWFKKYKDGAGKHGLKEFYTYEDFAQLAWGARQAEIDKLNALLDVVCPERNCPVTYRRIHEGKGVIFAVHGTSSNSYADALEARIKTLEEDIVTLTNPLNDETEKSVEAWRREEEWRRQNCGCVGCCICEIPNDL